MTWSRRIARIIFPGLILGTCLAGAVGCFVALRNHEARILTIRTDSVAEQTGLRLSRYTNERLDRLANTSWDWAREGLAAQPAFVNLVRKLAREIPALETAMWLESDLSVRWFNPDTGPIILENWWGQESHRQAFSQAAGTGRPRISITTEGEDGNVRFVAYIPILEGNRVEGILVALIRADVFVESCMAATGYGFSLWVKEGNTPVFPRDLSKLPSPGSGPVSIRPIPFANRFLNIHASATPMVATEAFSRRPFSALLIGAGIGLLLTIVAIVLEKCGQIFPDQRTIKELTELLPGVLVIVDENGTILSANEESRGVLTPEPADLKGKTIFDLVRPDQCDDLRVMLDHVLEYHQGEVNTYLRSLDGRFLNMHIWAALARTGRQVRITLLLADMTHREEAEKRHKEKRLLLENQYDALERKNRELEGFLYTLSHDLKVPVVSIQGLGDLIQAQDGDNLSPDSRDCLKRINGCVKRIETMLHDLLELSRVGRVSMEAESLDVAEVVGEILEQHRAKIQGEGIRVEVLRQLGVVNANRKRIYQVFSNLIDNALKYGATASEPILRITCRANRDRIQYMVKDNGAGIDPEHHSMIFGIFQRLRTDMEGTGIGLTITKRIIESYGGSIRVESKPGEGSAFIFDLPAASANKPRRTESETPVFAEPHR